MIERILAEWLEKQPEVVRLAHTYNATPRASADVVRSTMTHLYEAMRQEGIHVFYCRRVINRVLYGTPEPEGTKSLGEHMLAVQGLHEVPTTLNGQLLPEDVDKLISDLRKTNAQKD